MKTYLSDTQRVEMALPAHMMLAVLLAGANAADPGPMPVARTREEAAKLPITISNWKRAWAEHEKRVAEDREFALAYHEFLRTKRLLLDACDEPVKDLFPERKRISVLKRIETLHARIVLPYITVDEPDPRKIGLIAYYLIQTLVEQEYLIIPERSAFGQALDVMLPGLSPWEGNTQQELETYNRLNHSAQKQLKHILRALKQEKYYLGLEVSRAA